MRKLLALVGAAAVTVGLTAGTAAAAEPETTSTWLKSDLTIVHGIPNLPVDVWINNAKIADNVEFTAVAPLQVRSGWVKVEFRNADSTQTLLKTGLLAAPKQSYSVVAHLRANGTPRTSIYWNNTLAAGSGNGRVTVRHDAAAPAVDIFANNAKIMRNLANPFERSRVVPGGTYTVKVAAAADNNVVAWSGELPIAAGKLTIVYAVGDLAKGSFTPLVQVLDLKRH